MSLALQVVQVENFQDEIYVNFLTKIDYKRKYNVSQSSSEERHRVTQSFYRQFVMILFLYSCVRQLFENQ